MGTSVSQFTTQPLVNDIKFEADAEQVVTQLPQFVGQVNAFNLFGLGLPFEIQYGSTPGILTGVATTIAPVPGAASAGNESLGSPKFILVHACILAAGVSNWSAFAYFITDGTNALKPFGVNGGLLTITLSGANIQITQNAGSTQTINWTLFYF